MRMVECGDGDVLFAPSVFVVAGRRRPYVPASRPLHNTRNGNQDFIRSMRVHHVGTIPRLVCRGLAGPAARTFRHDMARGTASG